MNNKKAKQLRKDARVLANDDSKADSGVNSNTVRYPLFSTRGVYKFIKKMEKTHVK